MTYREGSERPMQKPVAWFARMHSLAGSIYSALKARLYRARFGSHGRRFSFDPSGVYSYENIFVGENVNLGYRPVLIASRSKIVIGNNVMFGPQVTIRGGNHRIDIVGRAMIDIGDLEKRPEDDPGVTIEDDVWIGTRAIILAGVRVGRGAVVAAGAVVTKDVEQYMIVAGNPAKPIRKRWDDATIAMHEKIMFPSDSGAA